MGYHKRGHNGQITDYTPDDDDTTMYISSNDFNTVDDLLERIKEKWPEADLGDISILAQHIHTHCLGYDRYDPGDYTDYIVLSYNKK